MTDSNVIEVGGLAFTYPKAERPAIHGLEFQVEQGEIFGFLGPSGAGKSTTQKILIGLLGGYSGSASVLRRDLSKWSPEEYQRIGVSFEFPNHYLKLTALENLTYFSRLYNGPTETPQELLALVGLGEDGNMPVSQYSKGMKNRLSVARALLHGAELLFLDEPTAGMDPVNGRRIKQIVKSQKEAGKTVFLTTHDMSVAEELCDRVAFIVEGEISLIGRPRELKRRYGQPVVRVEYESPEGAGSREFSLQGLGVNSEFLSLLQSGEVLTLHSQEATMEEVFVQVTGRELT